MWTENKEMVVERGFNIHSMYDSKIDLNDRIHTFEALGKKQKGVSGINVCHVEKDVPHVIYDEIHESILQIKDHLYFECNIRL